MPELTSKVIDALTTIEFERYWTRANSNRMGGWTGHQIIKQHEWAALQDKVVAFLREMGL